MIVYELMGFGNRLLIIVYGSLVGDLLNSVVFDHEVTSWHAAMVGEL